MPKGSPAARLCQFFMLLRLRMLPCAYVYRMCKHPCPYAYAWCVRVNQALQKFDTEVRYMYVVLS